MCSKQNLLSIKWNSIRLGGPAHEIVTKNVHKTLPGDGGGPGVGGVGVVGLWQVGEVRWWGSRGCGGGSGGGPGDGEVVGVQGVGGVDLDHIPLNFPLGCGSGDPAVRSPSISPLGVGLDQIPLILPLGCGPGPDPPHFTPWLWAWTRSPPHFTPWLWAWTRFPSFYTLAVGLDQIPLNFPLGCEPRPDPPQLPPCLVWAWTSSPSISPLAVGLDQISLNFPLGSGAEPDPPQFLPWVWAWRPPSQIPLNFPLGYRPGPDPPSISPLGVSLDKIPLNFPLGCGPGPDPPHLPPWLCCPSPTDRQTDTCKNITLVNFVVGNEKKGI